MIDIHCHLLPYLDDGATDWETSLQMARIAVEDGTTDIITTPHWMGTETSADEQQRRLEACRQRLEEAGLSLRLHPGNEVVLVPGLSDAFRSGNAQTLAGSNYVLLETAQLERGLSFLDKALYQLQADGFRLILAHPERMPAWQRDGSPLAELLERDIFLQVNAGSLQGRFGRTAQATAERFIRSGWVSLVASDAHSLDSRPPGLSVAREICSRLIGEEAAAALFEQNPRRILENRQLPYVEPKEPRRRSWFSFLRRAPR